MSERCHSCAPRVASRHSEQSQEGASETFEVYVVIHVTCPFHFTEVHHATDWVDVDKQDQESTNVRQGLHGDNQSVEDQLKTLSSSPKQSEQS